MSVYITEDTLGRLDIGQIVLGGGLLDCNLEGYVVTGWTVGFPVVRSVIRGRALGDGVVDDSRYVGERSISFNVTLDTSKTDPQASVDALTPYLSPRRRPRLHWTIPGSTMERSAMVRGADAPLQIAGKQLHVITASWIAPDGVLESTNENLVTINPSGDSEDGRTYDLAFDRTYPPSAGLGERIVTNHGNTVADWKATIFGATTNPRLIVNGVTINFNRNGGLDLASSQLVTLNSRERTVLYNDDPTESRYDKMNFTDWSWDQVRLEPGENIVRFEADTLSAQSQVRLSYRDAYL